MSLYSVRHLASFKYHVSAMSPKAGNTGGYVPGTKLASTAPAREARLDGSEPHHLNHLLPTPRSRHSRHTSAAADTRARVMLLRQIMNRLLLRPPSAYFASDNENRGLASCVRLRLTKPRRPTHIRSKVTHPPINIHFETDVVTHFRAMMLAEAAL
jgi:hypothetical protein